MTHPASYDIGQVLAGRYRLVEHVGEGGVGDVFRAEHVYIDKTVAVKLLRPHAATDPAAVERLYVEARATSRIGHPNIVRIEDCGQADDHTPYLVMEWLDGETLEALTARGPIEPMTALGIAAQVCEGLAAAHAAGVIHRDLKPANIFLTRDRRGAYVVKILDFGIAKLASGDASLTQTGAFVGTPYYISPEQALGHDVDARADIYSLGVILYELFTGTVPFVADTFMAIVHQHTSREPEPPRRRAAGRDITTAVEEIILRCMAKDRDARYPNTSALRAALDAVGATVSAGSSARPRKRTTERGIAIPRAPRITPPGLAETPQPAPPEPPTPTRRADERAGDSEAWTIAPRRRSRLAVAVPLALVAAGAAVAIYAGLGGTEPSRRAGSPPPVAANEPVLPPRADAAPTPTAPAIPETAWRYQHGDLEVAVAPRIAPVGEPLRLFVHVADADVGPTDEATLVFYHYLRHREHRRVRTRVGPNGWIEATPTLSEPGKYHVDLITDATRRRFDICVGADADADPSICPRMNPTRGDS